MTSFDIILSGMYFPNQFANIMLCINVTGVGTMIGLKSGKVIAYGQNGQRGVRYVGLPQEKERDLDHMIVG